MKHLRQYIRQILLTEAMKMPSDLPDGIGVSVRIRKNNTRANITYCRTNNTELGRVQLFPARLRRDEETGIYGEVSLYKINQDGLGEDCDGAWTINETGALEGYGPLLYDIAIEVASIYGTGLIADRRTVSSAAQGVWQYYLDNRPDVKVFQCDDTKNSLTPDDNDNLDQTFTKKTAAKFGGNWFESPLSKRFSKEDTMMKELDSLGKFILVHK